MEDLKLWFVCKLCRSSLFNQVAGLIEHKIEKHSCELQNLKCLIFEESIVELSVSAVVNLNSSVGQNGSFLVDTASSTNSGNDGSILLLPTTTTVANLNFQQGPISSDQTFHENEILSSASDPQKIPLSQQKQNLYQNTSVTCQQSIYVNDDTEIDATLSPYASHSASIKDLNNVEVEIEVGDTETAFHDDNDNNNFDPWPCLNNSFDSDTGDPASDVEDLSEPEEKFKSCETETATTDIDLCPPLVPGPSLPLPLTLPLTNSSRSCENDVIDFNLYPDLCIIPIVANSNSNQNNEPTDREDEYSSPRRYLKRVNPRPKNLYSYPPLIVHPSNSRKNPFVSIKRLSREEIKELKETAARRKRTYRKLQACIICNLRCHSKFLLTKHFSKHAVNGLYECPRPNCPRTFHSHSKLRLHLERHDKEELHPGSVLGLTHVTYSFPKQLSEQEDNVDDPNDPLTLTLAEWFTKKIDEAEATDNNKILLVPDPRSTTSTSTSENENEGFPKVCTKDNPVTCKLCSKQLTSDIQVKIHVKYCWLKNTRRHRYCIPCDKTFSSPPILRLHTKKFHSDESGGTHGTVKQVAKKPAPCKYTCEICAEEFSLWKEHHTHKVRSGHWSQNNNEKLAQTRLKTLLCESCGYSTYQKSKLVAHVAYRHSDARPYACEYDKNQNQNSDPPSALASPCTDTFKTKRQLDYHIEIAHLNSCPRPHACPVEGCGKTFKSAGMNGLKKHHLICHTNDHPRRRKVLRCPQENCTTTFLTAELYHHHLKKVHDVGEWGEHPCPICGKSFALRSTLRTHSFTHVPEKPFKCTWENCSAAFRRKPLLREHENSKHTGQKPFQCFVCGKPYAKSVSYHAHMKTHRRNEK